MISSVSFVVIAHNEEMAVGRCLNAIARMKREDCEVICVDSGSTDGTLSIMMKAASDMPDARIYRIFGRQNASIARNVGWERATKEVICFVDGDVELNEAFVRDACDRIRSGRADAVVGSLDEQQYEPGSRRAVKYLSNVNGVRGERRVYYWGGIFLIRRATANKVGKFDHRMDKSQDYDFGLRFSRRYNAVQMSACMGVHHTVPYSAPKRLREILKKGYVTYQGAALRKNWRNVRGVGSFLVRSGPGKGLLLLLFALALVAQHWLWGLVVVALLSLDAVAGVVRRQPLSYRLVSHYLYPFFLVKGLVGTLPNRGSEDGNTTVVEVDMDSARLMKGT